jgi:hypothetical protein
MPKTIVRGCGMLVCRHNDFGVCKLKGMIVGANGSCLLMDIDAVKAREDMQKEEALKEMTVGSTSSPVVNKIGFCAEEEVADGESKVSN